jgi:tRNA A-37 threonylcarbamoyl transferase component Bud32
VSERADAERPLGSRVLAGRYRLIEFIARGGMAEVWEGHDVLLARRVAVKLPHPHLGRQEAFRRRFRREAVAAARLSHSNIVSIFDTGTDDEDNFIVMERVDGPSLRQLLVPDRPLPVERAVSITGQVANALEYAHRQGVIHRDIKPANILIGDDGMVKVADFGIAKAALGDDMTQTGTALGTARYLAPEQVEGGLPDRRSDIYSLGVVLYEMVCGRPPFQADNELALAMQHLRNVPPTPRSVSTQVPPWLEAVVLTALAKSPDQRFASADQLGDALAQGPAWTGPYPATDGGGATEVDRVWSRPVPIGAEQRRDRPPTGPEPAGPWAPTGAMGATPTDRDRPHPGGPGWPQPPDDRPFATGTQAFDAPPAPPTPGAPTGRRRSRRRLVPLLAIAIAIAAAVVAAVLIAHLDGSSSHGTSTSSQGTVAGAHGTPVVVARAAAFDPPPGDGVEDDGDLAHLLDGNASTTWHTEFYASRQFGGLKPGVGFVLTLAQSRQLQDLVLASPTPQYDVSVYVSSSSPSQLSGWGQPVATASNAPARAVVPLHGHQGSHVLVWFTRLSPTNVVQISQAQVTA